MSKQDQSLLPLAAKMSVIIADDHAIFRNSLATMLQGQCSFRQVHEVGDFDSLLRLLERGEKPDLLILDLNMPGFTPESGIMTLRTRIAPAPILVLSASDEAEVVFECLGAGASGYVPKSADFPTLITALRTVLMGGVHVPRDLLVGAVAITPSTAATGPRISFTQRQRQVLNLASEGHANKEIAYRLGISEGTVKTHLAAVMRALSVNNRVQMLREAEKLGLVN